MSRETDERIVREFCEENEISPLDAPTSMDDLRGFLNGVLAALIRKTSGTRFDPDEE